MFFPIRTDRRLHHTPWTNFALIGINVAVFLLTRDSLNDPAVARFFLDPVEPRLYQFITYQFLHGDAWHLLGNMLFLYVFGNSIEDRLGKVAYLGFFLAGGVLAGVGHALVEPVPVLGASGSVAAVTGAYLALFPMSNVTIVYWFIFIGAFEVSSIVLILIQVGENVVMYLYGASRVAYLAHLAGYAFGFTVGMLLLWTRLLQREPYDLLSMIEHRRRRRAFHNLTREGYTPWEGKIAEAEINEPTRKLDPRVPEMRAQIASELNAHNLETAAAHYEQLLAIDPLAVMGRQQQLDLANQLMSMNRHEAAGRGYELFLSTYRADGQREQVELILGLLCARYLNRRQRAKELLTSAMPRLQEPQQRALAQQVLDEIG